MQMRLPIRSIASGSGAESRAAPRSACSAQGQYRHRGRGGRTSAGSLALDGSHPAKDSFVAAKPRAAGALIIGKTNLSEWANFRSTHSVSGWSGRGDGGARNPYALDRNPSGSSSGSGVAVAANLCAAAVGTETDGSVVSPASINGIVGIKPTLGLISR